MSSSKSHRTVITLIFGWDRHLFGGVVSSKREGGVRKRGTSGKWMKW